MPNLPRLNQAAPIYLDNAASTQLDPSVLAAMAPFLDVHFGNPSNPSHDFGAYAADAVEGAREKVALLLSARSEEIVFTSGATESNNLAILGTARAARVRGNHIVTIVTEHKSVLAPCQHLEREGFQVTFLPVDKYGAVRPGAVRDAITPQTILVSVMLANNEVGTLQRVAEIAGHCIARDILIHTDATQAVGKLPIDVDALGVDLLSASAHKLYGPKGTGLLYIRRRSPRIRLEPLFFGGGQEGGIRPGTLAVANIVGLGAACELAGERLEADAGLVSSLRDRLQDRIARVIPNAVVNGHPDERLPGLLSVSFPGVDGEALALTLAGVAFGRGASCSAGTDQPSHVLTAMGLEHERAVGTIRFGVGRFNTPAEIDRAVVLLHEALCRLLPTNRTAL